MPATTPISRSKSAALARILDVVPRGYNSYTQGTVSADKAPSLARKFHHLYGIGLSPAKRLTKKKNRCANTLLTMYWPEGAEEVSWVLQVTSGGGIEMEKLRRLDDTPRLHFLGYELVRLATLGGKSPWTWRRPKEAMTDLHILLAAQAASFKNGSLDATLQRIARQPGFRGVYRQSHDLFRKARQLGYSKELPKLWFLRKISHGEPFQLEP